MAAWLASITLLLGLGITVFRSFPAPDRPLPKNRLSHWHSAAVGHEDHSMGSGSGETSVQVPICGRVQYVWKECQVPPGDWLRDADGEEFRQDVIDLWMQPEVYFGNDGEILHVLFSANMEETVSLESLAIQKLRDESGLAVVRPGYPEDIDRADAKERFLHATLEWWVRGLEAGIFRSHGARLPVEYSMTPVIVQVLSAAGPLSGVRGDSRWIGRYVPMVLIRTAQAAPLGEMAVLTDSDFDRVEVKDRIRRAWILVPYLSGGPDGPDQELDGFDISASSLMDEPLLEAWNRARESLPKGQGR